ncbi:MAG: methyl-accepting chemotaxis protein [Treponema sp.]|jgi:methyl-accepting chemotaxis protein|nr:methyl-accepting chemotaxis protein [Treponema sp.]
MKLRSRLLVLLVGLGMLTAFGGGITIFMQYDQYIKETYRERLSNVLTAAEDLFPIFSQIDYLVKIAEDSDEKYWDLTADMHKIANAFGLAYIYLVRPYENSFQIIISDDYTPDLSLEDIFFLYERNDIPEMMQEAYRTNRFQISPEPFTNSWGTFVSAYVPIRKDGRIVGVLGADLSADHINALSVRKIIALIVSLSIAVVISLITALLISRSIANPIVKVVDAFKHIAEGDLTQSISTKGVAAKGGADELVLMTRMIASAQEGIRSLIVAIVEKAHILSDIGGDLASNMNVTANAINQITANVQSIKERVQNQSAYVSQTHGTMEQLVDNIHKLDTHVGNQSSNVSQASSAIEEMVANTRSVTDTLIKNTANVHTLREASEVGRGGLQEVAADIQEISRESEGLLEINSVMQNIASQTNLLSMNAAIEAAHAGEAGKGFAVVADEIRKLAESSSEQSKTIGNVLKKIKSSIDKITRSTENVLGKFEAIDTGVKTVAEQEDNIRNAMEEQGAGSKQVLEGVGNVNEITRQVTTDSGEMLERAKEVIAESNNLEKATQEISSGMNEMASGAEEINMAVNHVKEISGKNREAIDVLLKEVSRFKVE